ncbi:MAG: AAA family ATPase, partial [Weeksellaceae bacterium]|nr:AAA family ATPase [Weeksellaceae bacterium]
MELRRIAEILINKKIQPNKVILLLGARRVGKTEILKKIESEAKEKVIFLNGDDVETHNLLEVRSTANYKRLLGDCHFLIIDEAQEIPEIGKKMKLMIDTIDGLKIIASGSSTFELNNQIGAPLVRR